jgi:hypothetical protein
VTNILVISNSGYKSPKSNLTSASAAFAEILTLHRGRLAIAMMMAAAAWGILQLEQLY